MARLETVEINRNGTRVIINKRDFDAEKHKLWDDNCKPEYADDSTISMEDRQYLELADEYTQKFGKKPHHKAKAETIRAALDEKAED